MVVELRKKEIDVRPFRLVLWAVVLAVVSVSVLHLRPLTIDDEPDRSEGMEYTPDTGADTLVVIDYEAIRQSGDTFEELDFSVAWIDLVQREIGPVSATTPDEVTPDTLDEFRAVILTHSVADDLSEAAVETFREYALDGHTLVVERPRGEARQLFSADGAAGVRTGRQITHVSGVDDDFVADFESMPVLTDYIGSTSPRDDAETLLAIDGAPVVYVRPFGDGRVVTVDFDLGRQLVTLRQGRPDADFGVHPPEDVRRPPRTADLVADDDLLGAPVPYADLLERFITYEVLVRRGAIPGLWAYPDAAAGAVIIAHEDARLGDGGAWKLDDAAERGISSTLLTTVDAGLTEEKAESIRTRNGQIGLAWRPDDPSVALYERLGVGRFEPLRQSRNLDDQLDELGSVVSAGRIRTARSLYGIWSDEWTAPLEILAAGGIRADFSYETPSHRGYSFGTGRPYLPITAEGLPLNLRQYPITAPATADDGPSVDDLLARSAEGHHQLLTVGTRPAMYADYPDIERFEEWESLLDAIAARNHRAMSAAEYAAYQRRRRGTSLRSRFDEREPLPEEFQSEDTGPDHTADMLRITVEADTRNMVLVIPDQIGDASLYGALEGTERVGADLVTTRIEPEEASIAGFSIRQISLDRGFNDFELYYR